MPLPENSENAPIFRRRGSIGMPDSIRKSGKNPEIAIEGPFSVVAHHRV